VRGEKVETIAKGIFSRHLQIVEDD